MSFAMNNVWKAASASTSSPAGGSGGSTTATPSSHSLRIRSVFGGLMHRTISGESDQGLPEARTTQQLMEIYGDQVKEMRIQPTDTQRIVDDPTQFSKIQQSLREGGAVTNGTLRLRFHSMVRERLEDMDHHQQQQESNMKQAETSPVRVKKTAVSTSTSSPFASPQSVTRFVPPMDDKYVTEFLGGTTNLSPRREIEVEAQ